MRFQDLIGQLELLEFLQRVGDCAWNKRLTKSSANKMGLVPEEIRKGGVVVIRLGCSVPITLRRMENYYKFIGEAYIHVIMQDEAMRGLDEGADTFQDFILI